MKSRTAHCLSVAVVILFVSALCCFSYLGVNRYGERDALLEGFFGLASYHLFFFLHITVWLSRLVMRNAEQQRSIYLFTCFAPKQNGSPSSLLKACLEAQIAASSLLLSLFSSPLFPFIFCTLLPGLRVYATSVAFALSRQNVFFGHSGGRQEIQGKLITKGDTFQSSLY